MAGCQLFQQWNTTYTGGAGTFTGKMGVMENISRQIKIAFGVKNIQVILNLRSDPQRAVPEKRRQSRR